MKINEDFVRGVAYYLGDGRMSTPRSLSTVNQNAKVIRFFIQWLKRYFNLKIKDLRIKIRVSNPNFNKDEVLKEYSKKLGIKKRFICSVSLKHNSKPHHRTIIEVWAHRTRARKLFDNSLPIVKMKCKESKKLAIAYLQGIMAAEGSPKYDKKSGSRNVHLKMKNEEEIKFIGELLNKVLNVKSSILKLRTEEGMWLITISGFYELHKIEEMDIFEMESEKRERFKKIVGSYKRAQTKKGDIKRFYIEKLNFYNKKLNKSLTSPELAKLIGRDRTRTVNVLRQLERKGFLKSQRRRTIGRPFEFWAE